MRVSERIKRIAAAFKTSMSEAGKLKDLKDPGSLKLDKPKALQASGIMKLEKPKALQASGTIKRKRSVPIVNNLGPSATAPNPTEKDSKKPAENDTKRQRS